MATHEVTNQPPPLEDFNLCDKDRTLVEGLGREGAELASERVSRFGEILGSRDVLDLGREANRRTPELRSHDRFGHRIDEVRYHPAYHHLMSLAMEQGAHSLAWTAERGGHVAHAALLYLLSQVETGVCCPISMTYAAVPSLRHQPDLAEEWLPRLLRAKYDPRFIPAPGKRSATMGMAMTEKQGGSDVRANTTRAKPIAGSPGEYRLTGHKWFCSAPMSDAFLTLAQAEEGLSCFFVPRWTPGGERNPFLIQRLKDKLGNRSNASSEIEYDQTWARLVGEEGGGVKTIIEMVHHTRLDASLAPAGLMRMALVQAIHHARHRRAFGKLLVDQPLMRNVLADLALESQAATLTALRVARAFDEGSGDPEQQALARIAVAVAKYWLNKRAPSMVCEALECLGGGGYVEESILPRLYREAPLNGIWEGSGNVICLDVLRSAQREPESMQALLREIGEARGADRRLDKALDDLVKDIENASTQQSAARRLVERLATALQASLMLRHAHESAAEAFCASRLTREGGWAFGTLPSGTDFKGLIDLAFSPN